MSKKEALKEKMLRKQEESHQSDQEEEEDKPKKETNQQGEDYWCLGKNKRVSVSSFKGTTYVNLREYFEKDGKALPTKKGITLNLQAWNNLKKLIADIDATLHPSK